MQALLVMDMWDTYHGGHTRFQNIQEQTVSRITNVIKRFSGPVVLCCYQTTFDDNVGDWRQPDNSSHFPWTRPNIMLENAVRDKDKKGLISWDTDEVKNFLRSYNVNRLIYSGASYPGCVLWRPLGADNMKEFNPVMLVDCLIHHLSTGYNEHEIIHDAYRYALNKNINPYEVITSDLL